MNRKGRPQHIMPVADRNRHCAVDHPARRTVTDHRIAPLPLRESLHRLHDFGTPSVIVHIARLLVGVGNHFAVRRNQGNPRTCRPALGRKEFLQPRQVAGTDQPSRLSGKEPPPALELPLGSLHIELFKRTRLPPCEDREHKRHGDEYAGPGEKQIVFHRFPPPHSWAKR